MPLKIQNPRAWGRLVDAFTLTGRHKLLLDEVVVPVAIIEDLSEQAGTEPDDATMFVEATNVAATLGAAVLSNLGETGAVLLLDRIIVTTSAVQFVGISQTTIAPILPLAGSIIVKQWNDPRKAGAPTGTGFANTNVFGTTNLLFRPFMSANIPYTFDVKQVIPPNNQIAVGGFTVNVELNVTFQYRVRSE